MDRLSDRISHWIEQHREEAAEFVSKLVQIESVNHPPGGHELHYQEFLADWMRAAGADVDFYYLHEVPDLQEHPAYFHNRRYENRPNTVGSFFGHSSGPSLMFSGHADTVYEGKEAWTHPPFSGHIESGKLYGRGAYDMKGGMAAALMAVKCLQELNIPIAGSVYVESVVDEEHGGANGTLAGRLRGPHADMAIIPEPSNLKLYPAHLGGGIWKASFIGKSGIGFAGEKLISALDATVQFANLLRDYNVYRDESLDVPLWWQNGRKAQVMPLTIHSGDINRELQEKLPEEGEINFWIEGYPGMTGEAIIRDLQSFLESRHNDYPLLQICKPTIRPLIRYLSASEMKLEGSAAMFLESVVECGEAALGEPPAPPMGSPFACDGFMFNLYSETPALILGPGGGNAHAADEFLDLESYEKLIHWYAEIIVNWCGTTSAEVK